MCVMGKRTYSLEQEKWIIDSINKNKYERTIDFLNAFNREFNTDKTWILLRNKIDWLGLSCNLVGANEYTDSEKKWIKENYNLYPSVEKVLIEFNKTFNSNKSLKSFRQMANTRLNLKRTTKTLHCDGYTIEQEEWLTYVCKNRIYSGLKEITDEFNMKFNTDKTTTAIQSKISKLKLHAKATHYSDKEILWILENKDSDSWNELSKKFSSKFGRDITATQLRHASADKGMFKNDRYKFHSKYRVGDEVVMDGYVYVKIANRGEIETSTTKPSRELFKQKAQIVWEENFGNIPEGYQILFLDGNKLNCDISNLSIVPLSICGSMSKNGFWSLDDVELKKTAIMYCELVNKMNQK